MKKFFAAAKFFALFFTAVVLSAALAGIVRFNFTNDDIYIQTENGEIVKYGAHEERIKNIPKNLTISVFRVKY